MAKNFLLEIACFNFEAALIAEQGGADRIELCENYSLGGVTPGMELIQKVKSQVNIPVHVMIRPRSGNFVYSNAEFEEMKNSVQQCRDLKLDGVVFGILDEDNFVDKQKCAELINLAGPMSAVFHRAFDEINNPLDALEEIMDCGFTRILTSGKKQSAAEGKNLISELISNSNQRIIVMPGGGIRSGNISEIKNETGAMEFHSSAMNFQALLPDKNEILKMKQLLSS